MTAEKIRRIENWDPGTWREINVSPRKWVKQIRVRLEVDPWGETIDEFSDRIKLLIAEHGLEDTLLDLDTEYGSYRDRDRDHVYLTGWREPTSQELAHGEEEAKRRVEQRENVLLVRAEQAKQLLKDHPELFE